MSRKRQHKYSLLNPMNLLARVLQRLRPGRRAVLAMLVVVCGAGLAIGGTRAAGYLDQRLNQFLLARSPQATIEFVNLPEGLVALAGGDLRGSISELLELPWTDPNRCREITERLAALGWIESIDSVQRNSSGRFEVHAHYRMPVALVGNGGDDYVLVDGQGVRLPGLYVYHPRWYVIDGVESPPGKVGVRWESPELQAGLALLSALRPEPYRHQIAGINVANFAGRKNSRVTHLELITDRPGGRIRWGSAPGYEVEENLAPQKMALLRQNFTQTGRADAGHSIIDVSTFPDRFHIPG